MIGVNILDHGMLLFTALLAVRLKITLNPPFVGGMYMSSSQKDDITEVMVGYKSVGEMDYVAGWYKKAIDLMNNNRIRAAFVSTNSICQGQQATTLWANLLNKGIIINFAHQSFIWNSEATVKAHVHCIIVGFSLYRTSKTLLSIRLAILKRSTRLISI